MRLRPRSAGDRPHRDGLQRVRDARLASTGEKYAYDFGRGDRHRWWIVPEAIIRTAMKQECRTIDDRPLAPRGEIIHRGKPVVLIGWASTPGLAMLVEGQAREKALEIGAKVVEAVVTITRDPRKLPLHPYVGRSIASWGTTTLGWWLVNPDLIHENDMRLARRVACEPSGSWNQPPAMPWRPALDF